MVIGDPPVNGVTNGPWFVGEPKVEYVESPVVAFLKGEVDRLRADLAAALESERRLWRAYAMLKGAAEGLDALAFQVHEQIRNGFDVDAEAMAEARTDAAEMIEASEKLAGVAVEG